MQGTVKPRHQLCPVENSMSKPDFSESNRRNTFGPNQNPTHVHMLLEGLLMIV